MGALVYIAIKFFAYSLWCLLGLRWFEGQSGNQIRRAFKLGLVRLLIGIGLGLFIFIAALKMNNATRDSLLTYLVIYVPVRFFEWLVIAFFIKKKKGLPQALLWILGGIVVSCLADLTLLAYGERIIPVGRPFC